MQERLRLLLSGPKHLLVETNDPEKEFCVRCPLYHTCLDIEPRTVFGTYLEKEMFEGYLICVHYACLSGRQVAINTASYGSFGKKIVDGEVLLLAEYGTIDKPTAKPENMKRHLSQNGLADYKDYYRKAKRARKWSKLRQTYRYVDKEGNGYSTNDKGEIKRTGQRLFPLE